MIEIKWREQYSTGQIYSNGIEMALCSKNNEQIGPFVFCKDFFQDAVSGFLNKKKTSIYAYTYNPESEPPIDLYNIRVLIANSEDNKFSEKLPAILDFLGQVEDKMGLRRTAGMICSDHKNYPGGVLLLVGDEKWMISPPSLSMYGLLLRTSTVHKVGQKYTDTIQQVIKGRIPPAQRNDHIYLDNAQPGMELIMTKGMDAVFGSDIKKNFDDKIQTHTLHHNGGIVAFSSARFKGVFSHWMYPENPSNPPGVCFS